MNRFPNIPACPMAQQINRYEMKRQGESRKQNGVLYRIFINLPSFHLYSPL